MIRHLPMLLIAAIAAGPACTEYDFSEFESTDIFHQNPWRNVDVLLVVDNSGSMGPFQEKLADDFGVFFDFFADGSVDWRIGVVNTDVTTVNYGLLRGAALTADHPDPDSVFADMVSVGTEGWGIEAGLETGLAAVSGINPGFPREDASLSVIFVSDEQDASPHAVSWFIDEFYAIKGHRNRDAFNASALVVSDPTGCTPEQVVFATRGTRYEAVAHETGGVIANLCDEDLEPIVNELALTTSSVRDTFFLSRRPDPDTLVVGIDDELVDCEGNWTYELIDEEGFERPAIVFAPEAIPEADAQIVAHYTQGSGNPAPYCPAPGGELP